MRYVKRLDQMTKDEYQETGGKAANLGEMIHHGFNVPGGFCVTGKALDYLLEANGTLPKLARIAAAMDFEKYDEVERKSADMRLLVSQAAIPEDLLAEIRDQINGLKSPSGQNPFVAVRSSVAVKGSTISSFPGMMDTYHFLKGEAEILEHIRRCWASLYTARAMHRRHQQNIPQDKGIIAPIVQRMVNSEIAGVMFTANPITSARDQIVIESNWGLGESLVSGEAIVDYFVVERSSPPRIKEKRVQNKNIMVCLDAEKGSGRKKIELSGRMVTECTLSDEQLFELAELGERLEAHFQSPQDIEWAYEKRELFILQSRKIKGLKD